MTDLGLRANHTGITVSSLDDALAFWVDVLGFDLLVRTRYDNTDFLENLVGVRGAALTLAMVQAPGYLIELLEYDGPVERSTFRPRSCDVGSVHLAFLTDNLQAVLERVEKAGWPKVGEPQIVNDGPRQGLLLAYVRGPDGVTLEFLQPGPSGITY